ncbi:hypothetical protein [Haloglomus salinum]|uniref:hypothetical protein n=1 Tax=Haloglomus salinum TaxID=2962673 RepID=UPI0020CA0FB5|nr:hypothetical protein [Haloglomus salinum]
MREVVEDAVPDLPVAALREAGLGAQFDALEEAVGGHLEGERSNVAVVAEPFAGRAGLLAYAEEYLGAAAERRSFDGLVVDPGEAPEPDSEAVVVDGCHYLYTRRVGGFDPLERFIDRVTDSDAMFVTAWNSYAWDYLRATRDVDAAFPIVVRLPPLDAGGVRDLIYAMYGPDLPRFESTKAFGRVKTLDFEPRTVSLTRSVGVEVTVPTLNLSYLTARAEDDVGEVEAVVFERLTRLSEGNPGVAAALWARSVEDGTISPASVEALDRSLDLDDDAGFVLLLVLTNGAVDREVLAAALPEVQVRRSLTYLADRDLVALSDDVAWVEPTALHPAAEYLRGRRLLW